MSTDTAAAVADIAERNPLAHPGVSSLQLFNYSLPPGDHLKELYNAVWKAVDEDYPNAPKKVARLLPRGHGKTESSGVVCPAWAILSIPEIRVAVISKTKDIAAERTAKVVDTVERHAPLFGVGIDNAASTQLTTDANTHKEATIAPYGLESQLTGKHFDIIIWDDIADWDNQRTEKQRRNVREYFRDYTKNLGDPDSVLAGGAVQVMIGTRKHPNDIYATDILDSATWDVKIRKAINEADWKLIEERAWAVRGDDGKQYPSVGDLPPDVNLANNGVIPDRPIDVLWPEHKPPESLLYDIIDGDNTLPIWRRENQQDPHALAGEVFESDWLDYVPELPKPASSFQWVVGMDLGLVEDLQQAAENDTDWTALAVIAWDRSVGRGYLTDLQRERGMSVKRTAEWAEEKLEDVAVDAMLVEQNANRGVAQRLRDNSALPAKGTDSTSNKEERIHNMAAEFESSTLRIVGDATDRTWSGFETDEWLQFPNAAHDDRLDAIEIALRQTAGTLTRRTPASAGKQRH